VKTFNITCADSVESCATFQHEQLNAEYSQYVESRRRSMRNPE